MSLYPLRLTRWMVRLSTSLLNDVIVYFWNQIDRAVAERKQELKGKGDSGVISAWIARSLWRLETGAVPLHPKIQYCATKQLCSYFTGSTLYYNRSVCSGTCWKVKGNCLLSLPSDKFYCLCFYSQSVWLVCLWLFVGFFWGGGGGEGCVCYCSLDLPLSSVGGCSRKADSHHPGSIILALGWLLSSGINSCKEARLVYLPSF